jgi:short-subunit dehydrogenase
MTGSTGSRTALVTGASAGIGAAFARQLAAAGHDVVLVARREHRLEELAVEIEAAHGVRCDVFAADLADPEAPAAIMRDVEARERTIDVLINNAGLSGNTAFADASWDSLGAELQVMVTAPTHLSRLAAPGMRARGWGRIVNVASIAALLPPPASLLYTPIKGYVLGLSRALHAELAPHGVHVTALCPGFTRTEFHDVMGTRATADRFPSFMWSTAEDVVRAGWDAVEAGRPICVPGALNKVLAATTRPLPLAVQDWFAERANPFS